MAISDPIPALNGGTRAYLVAKITCFIKSPAIREFHYDMFHGMAAEDDRSVKPRDIGSSEFQPLRITRNVFHAPEIFAPHTNFIVSARVRDVLAVLGNLSFMPVEFQKLVKYPYAIGDFSWYDNPECARPAGLFSLLKHVPEGREILGQYFEVLTPRLADVQASFNDLALIQANVGPEGYEKQIDVRLSAGLLRVYPMLFVPGAKVLNELAFNAIKTFLDLDFFTVTTVMVS